MKVRSVGRMLVLAGLFVAWAGLPGIAGEGGRHARGPHVVEVTVTGTLSGFFHKDGEGNVRASYTLITPTGERYAVTTGFRAEDGQPTPAQLEKFRDKVIMVTGKVRLAPEDEKGGATGYLYSITRITIVDPDAGK